MPKAWGQHRLDKGGLNATYFDFAHPYWGVEKQFKIIVEKHPDGYVAYPLGLKGIVVGEGDTYEEALADMKSAIHFHIETFGSDVFEDDEASVLEAFVAETGVTV